MPNTGLDRNRNAIVRLENSIVQSQDLHLMALYNEEISDCPATPAALDVLICELRLHVLEGILLTAIIIIISIYGREHFTGI